MTNENAINILRHLSPPRTSKVVFDAFRQAIEMAIEALKEPQIIQCKDCKYWNNGSCEYREHAVNCQDYMVGDIETEAEHFCGYAERRDNG